MMKFKKLAAFAAAAVIGLTVVQATAMAEGQTQISGDWVDVSGKAPSETLTGGSVSAWAGKKSSKTYEDAIIEFDWVCTDARMQAQIETRKSEDGKNSNWVYFGADAANMHRLIRKSGTDIAIGGSVDGFLDGKDEDFPTFTNGNQYKIRIQMKGNTLSAWAEDLGTSAAPVESPVWKYAGYLTTELFNEEAGYVGVTPITATTMGEVKIYSLDETAALSKTGAGSAVLKLSAAPKEDLNLYSLTLSDHEQNSLAVENIEKVSDTEYKLDFEQPFAAGVKYTPILNAKTPLDTDYKAQSFYVLDAAVDANFADDLWREQLSVLDKEDGDEVSNLNIQEGWLVLGWNRSIVTKNKIASNSIVEFDAKGTTDGMWLSCKTGISENGKNWYRTRLGENQVRRIIENKEKGDIGDGFFNGNYKETFAVNKTYSFRYVTNGNTVTAYVKGENDADYTKAGTFTSDKLVQNEGTVLLAPSYVSDYASYWNNIRIYETDSKARISADGEAIYVEYSIEPSEDLSGAIQCNGIAGERIGNKTYKFTIPGGVKTYETYTVTVPEGTKNIAGGNVSGAELKGMSYTLTAGENTVKAQILSADRASEAAVICAAYNADNTLADVEIKKLSDKDDTDALTFFDGKAMTGKSCKLFIWDSASGMKVLGK